MGRKIDLTGKTFGKLTVVGGFRRKNGRSYWTCRCECGVIKDVEGCTLRGGQTKSCGCYSREATAAKLRKYGKRASTIREYRIWQSMKARCQYQTRRSWAAYGGRGITVCERWNESFPAFLEDMGPAPSVKHSIDRIDNDKGYCPENCRWATNREQSLNRRNNRRLTLNGVTLTSKEWSEKIGIDRGTIEARIDCYGWSVEKALTTPKVYRGVRKSRSA